MLPLYGFRFFITFDFDKSGLSFIEEFTKHTPVLSQTTAVGLDIFGQCIVTELFVKYYPYTLYRQCMCMVTLVGYKIMNNFVTV